MNRWQQMYLNAIQAEAGPPGFDHLQRLIQLHLHRIPFENISKLHYYRHQATTGLRWLPAMETFLSNFMEQGLGGNCYILNVHFGKLLESLGYQVDIVRATGGNTHLALMVTVDRQTYYVDVGYGAPLFEPIVPEQQPHFTRYGEEVQIKRVADRQYRIDRRVNGNSLVTKYIEWTPVSLQSFDDVITHSLRDEDDNLFMRRVMATIFKPGGAYSVINNKLFVKSDKGTEVHEYTRKPDWMSMMRATFGFHGGVLDEALEFLSDRGLRLF
ncbi:arylamine N-acetyltransferase [Paenibacillus beijingensis]|uniref:Acetyltransferase n=1 Tax=Paenibacillus beijingensis TaxID=1126833 RepID=A0A0D5NFF1_9BACL|nr:arylamine N-acetyltransferase [Paenibacillus beijingensis]AJY73991.1 hypothetical protein VN24_04405 [Paenibacillus beijingensis]